MDMLYNDIKLNNIKLLIDASKEANFFTLDLALK
jgi:hypothetical protein